MRRGKSNDHIHTWDLETQDLIQTEFKKLVALEYGHDLVEYMIGPVVDEKDEQHDGGTLNAEWGGIEYLLPGRLAHMSTCARYIMAVGHPQGL
jgi:hypothetical protein